MKFWKRKPKYIDGFVIQIDTKDQSRIGLEITIDNRVYRVDDVGVGLLLLCREAFDDALHGYIRYIVSAEDNVKQVDLN